MVLEVTLCGRLLRSESWRCRVSPSQPRENDVACLARAGRVVVKKQTENIARCEQTANRPAACVDHLGVAVDLNAAEREGYAAGHRKCLEWRLVDAHRPIRFSRRN